MDIFEAVKEFGVFPSAVITGLALGAVFGFFECLHCFLHVHKAVRFAGDMLYMLFYWFTVFTLCAGTEGRLRYHIVAGVLAGSLCFYLTAGKLSLRASRHLARRLKSFALGRKNIPETVSG